METITREELSNWLEGEWDGVLIETLPPEYYREFHLPGAFNVPLDESFEQSIRDIVPDTSRPIVVYCARTECTASSDAGRKLVELGYEHVFDYAEGKTDWKEAGLPIETEHVETAP